MPSSSQLGHHDFDRRNNPFTPRSHCHVHWYPDFQSHVPSRTGQVMFGAEADLISSGLKHLRTGRRGGLVCLIRMAPREQIVDGWRGDRQQSAYGANVASYTKCNGNRWNRRLIKLLPPLQ